jgi:hypothetical protein
LVDFAGHRLEWTDTSRSLAWKPSRTASGKRLLVLSPLVSASTLGPAGALGSSRTTHRTGLPLPVSSAVKPGGGASIVPVSKSIRFGSVVVCAALPPTAAPINASATTLPKYTLHITAYRSTRSARCAWAGWLHLAALGGHHWLGHGYRADRKTHTAAPSPPLARTAR